MKEESKKYHLFVDDDEGTKKNTIAIIAKRAKRPRQFVASQLFDFGLAHAERVLGLNEKEAGK